jgi:hypothetical protein
MEFEISEPLPGSQHEPAARNAVRHPAMRSHPWLRDRAVDIPEQEQG